MGEPDSLILSNRRKQQICFILFGLALLLRVVILSSSTESIADGLTRTIQANVWSNSPRWLNSGGWLPGYLYVTGIFSFFIDNPWISLRIFNALVGSLTVSIYFLLLLRIYGAEVALISSSLLLFLPIHIGLSATSLTEVSFLLALVSGMLLLTKAADTKLGSTERLVYLLLACLVTIYATMSRYEAWVILFVFPVYYGWRSKHILGTLIIALCILIFPLYWMINNYLDYEDILPFFRYATKADSDVGVNAFWAIAILFQRLIRQITPILFVLLGIGLIREFNQQLRSIRNKVKNKEKSLYLIILIVFWTFMGIFTISRGESIRDRFLLPGIALGLPYCYLALDYFKAQFSRKSLQVLLYSCALVLILYSPGLSLVGVQSPNQLNPSIAQMKNISRWIENSPYNNAGVIMTEMNWSSLLIALEVPEVRDNFEVIYHESQQCLTNNLDISDGLLVITYNSGKDQRLKQIIEAELGVQLNEDLLIHQASLINLYAIANHIPSKSQLTECK